LWVSFYSFDQDEYLAIASHWVKHFADDAVIDDDVRKEALQWALARGSRSGRVAWQFARDYAGRIGMGKRR
jgi:predicted AAA+ superfamily ATPase